MIIIIYKNVNKRDTLEKHRSQRLVCFSSGEVENMVLSTLNGYTILNNTGVFVPYKGLSWSVCAMSVCQANTCPVHTSGDAGFVCKQPNSCLCAAVLRGHFLCNNGKCITGHHFCDRSYMSRSI